MDEQSEGADWRAGLRAFFHRMRREDEVFAEGVERAARFRAETVLPALDAAGRELSRFGKTYETGDDAGRAYIIVRGVGSAVEFQYAVVTEVTIEGVIPFVHCWYEAPPDRSRDGNSGAPGPESSGNDKDAEDGKDGKGKKPDDHAEDGEDEDGKPQRTKTVEPLDMPGAGGNLFAVTRDAVAADFLTHYMQAVSRSRMHMHAAADADPSLAEPPRR